MRIIPAIDIIDGKCVRLSQGDYARATEYADDPLEVAKSFEGDGAKFLHVVDLDGAREGRIINGKVLERICTGTSMQVDFGGGVRTEDDLRSAFDCGAAQVTVGSLAARNRPLFLEWLERYTPERVILGADVRNGMIAVEGWQNESDLEITEFLESYHAAGVLYTVCTGIDRDGMLAGPATELYESILQRMPDLRLIASGGATTVDDMLHLHSIGIDGVIIGKALYEGKVSLPLIAQELGGLG